MVIFRQWCHDLCPTHLPKWPCNSIGGVKSVVAKDTAVAGSRCFPRNQWQPEAATFICTKCYKRWMFRRMWEEPVFIQSSVQTQSSSLMQIIVSVQKWLYLADRDLYVCVYHCPAHPWERKKSHHWCQWDKSQSLASVKYNMPCHWFQWDKIIFIIGVSRKINSIVGVNVIK